ncbi:MAG TPA: DMT family transporter [Aestuariivirgaceae bacterium]|nr:DMT family transporter [Aestuariivirgaceae bacterium]
MTNRSLTGIAFICLGVAVFSIQDAVIKAVSGSYPVTEAVAIRSLVGLPIMLALVHYQTGVGSILSPRSPMLILRAAVMLLSYLTFYLAFPALPLADAVALWFMVPLIVTALAGPVLGERVPLKAWLAVGVGLLGVVIMLQPGTGLFKPAALLSLFAAFFYSAAMLMARRMGGTEGASVMAFYQNLAFLLGPTLLAGAFHAAGIEGASNASLDFLVRPWVMPPLGDLVLMGSCGFVAAAGMSLLTAAYRAAEAHVITPFEYTGLVWTPLWGYVFWHEVPATTTVIGASLIVGAGLWALMAGRPADEQITVP